MDGKTKCKILKQIRKQIADSNDIPFIIEACPHKGACSGTCPRCEEELRYLEKELAKRNIKKVAIIAGSAAAAAAIAAAGMSYLEKELQEMQKYQTQGVVPAIQASVEIEK